MGFSFSSMIRLIVLMVMGTTMLAVGLSRFDPPKPGCRNRVATRHFHVNEYFLNVNDRTPRWLDAEEGRLEAQHLEDGDILEAASCSPWVDEHGQRQVVGRWSSRTKKGPLSISTDFGLARYTYPGGRPIDHVSTEIVPVGPPCWFPGLRARILFAGGDGELYHYAFEADPWVKQSAPESKGDPSPVHVKWRCPKPGEGRVFLSDLSWPEDPRMVPYVVASLRQQASDKSGHPCFTRASLWWLKLDFDGTEIIEAGRLIDSDQRESLFSPEDQRSPTVGILPSKELAVAYLSRKDRRPGWELRIAPIEFRGDHSIPTALESQSRLLAEDCQPAYPSFSPDGRWLNAIGESPDPEGRVVRLSLATLFPNAK